MPFPMMSGGDQAMFNNIIAVKDQWEVHVVFSVIKKRYHAARVDAFRQRLGNVTVAPFVYNHRQGLFHLYYWFIDQIAQRVGLKKNQDFLSDGLVRSFLPVPLEYQSFVNDYVKKNDIHIVQMEMIDCLPFTLSLPSDVKKIFVHHEIRYVVTERKYSHLASNTYQRANVELSKMLEISLLNKCDAVVTLSATDALRLGKDGVTVPVYPSFATVDSQLNSAPSYEDGHQLVFIGPASHPPNVEGLNWFLSQCWDRLLEKDSAYCLKVIGRWPESLQKSYIEKYRQVTFAGFVPDLQEGIRNSIVIVPILSGSGIRMKILEAGVAGAPVVSTSVGAEGINLISGQDCFIADSCEGFVESIVKLNNRELRELMGGNIRSFVIRNYSIAALGENRSEIYRQVLNA